MNSRWKRCQFISIHHNTVKAQIPIHFGEADHLWKTLVAIFEFSAIEIFFSRNFRVFEYSKIPNSKVWNVNLASPLIIAIQQNSH